MPAILRVIPANAQSQVIKIGHVSPRTGPLSGFGQADPFVLEQIRKVLAKGVIHAGRVYPVEIISRDSQSIPAGASKAASELIQRDQVHLILAASTPDTTIPVADQAESHSVPCVTNITPWQPQFFGQNGDPQKGFQWTYHFFWGLEDVIAAFTALWESAPTNKIVGGLYDNHEGVAWADPETGFPPALKQRGFRLVDPGRYEPVNIDFTAFISEYKKQGCEIVTGNMIPPDFTRFWTQAAEQGFRPKIVTIGKALLFPTTIDSMGPRGNGLTTEIWWSPTHPFRSGLTGQSSRELADAYVAATKRPWTQNLGFKHSLFEVAIDVIKRAKGLERNDILEAVVSTDYQSIVGHVQWTGKPVKNVCKTPLVAGQWRRNATSIELLVTTNATAPEIPVGAPLELLL
jgi:branched-chain amino acid transport system substrate-binding protein